jgi:hypothetical protein
MQSASTERGVLVVLFVLVLVLVLVRMLADALGGGTR